MARFDKAHVHFNTRVDHAKQLDIAVHTAPWGGLETGEHSLNIDVCCEVDVNLTMTRAQLQQLASVIDHHLQDTDPNAGQ